MALRFGGFKLAHSTRIHSLPIRVVTATPHCMTCLNQQPQSCRAQSTMSKPQPSVSMSGWIAAGLALSAGLVTSVLFANPWSSDPVKSVVCEPHQMPIPPAPAKPLPKYTREEVAKHTTPETGIWVVYKGYVYDITHFVELHPGGTSKIMLAAGGSIEPFWRIYQQHWSSHVQQTLNEYRIGVLEGEEPKPPVDLKDPYENEPIRSTAMRVLSQRPYNAETPMDILSVNFLTSNDFFFVRNHFPVPTIDPKKFHVQIDGLGVRQTVFSLDELKQKFRKVEVIATLQCCGNRRKEMVRPQSPAGLGWEQGAIGNARWGGVLLRDVLIAAGLDLTQSPEIAHVIFEGLDGDGSGLQYSASIPIERAFSPDCDVLLAFEMNGEPLPRDHGFPLRVVVPGVTGARSVKWVHRITLSEEESKSQWQQKDYKIFPNTIDWNNVDWSKAQPINETNVQSFICEPLHNSTVEVNHKTPEIHLSGFAYSGGGRPISRVDVSPDGGKSWFPAEIVPPKSKQPSRKTWAWIGWQADLPLKLAHGQTSVQLVVRAYDISGNTQPEFHEPIWNLRGLSNNAWHRVNVTVQ